MYMCMYVAMVQSSYNFTLSCMLTYGYRERAAMCHVIHIYACPMSTFNMATRVVYVHMYIHDIVIILILLLYTYIVIITMK